MFAQRKIKPVAQQGLSQLGFASETMDNPRDMGRKGFTQAQQFIYRFHQMDNQRLSHFICQAGLPLEDRFLKRKGNSSQFVQPCFAHGQDLRKAYETGEMLPIGFRRIFRRQCPRMEADGIMMPLLRHKVLRRTADYAESGKRSGVMRMYVGKSKHKEQTESGVSFQGTGSYPEPPQGWQRSKRRMAR